MLSIDKQSPIPLYHQVEEAIGRDIAQKLYHPDQSIPTEGELQKAFGVSRETVRKAVNNLVLSGVLEKRRGVGTFVTRPKIVHRLGQLYSSTEEIVARGMTPGTTFIEKKKIRSSQDMQRQMGLEKGVDVIKVKRVRSVNGEPVAILRSYLPEDLVPNLTKTAFKDDSLYRTLEDIYGLRLIEADEVIEAGSMKGKDSDLLKTRKGSPVLVVKRLAYLDNSRIIEKLIALYRSDKFEYQVKLRGRPHELGA
jgi:GntR family transcriptional regulator